MHRSVISRNRNSSTPPAPTTVQPIQRLAPLPLPPVAQPSMSWKFKLIVLATVGLVSMAAGALLLPASRSAGRDASLPHPSTSHSHGNRGDVDATTGAKHGSATEQGAARESEPVAKSTGLNRPLIAPSAPPQRMPGAAATLAALIDRDIDRALAQAGIPASPLAEDAEFLRRVYLDITGQIPNRDAAVAFLDSKDPQKRAKLIDMLLASSEYGLHFAHLWTDLLVKRDFDNNRNLKTEPFTNWLAGEFNQGIGWDKTVTAMVTAEGTEESAPQTFFFLANQDNRQPAPDKLVGTVGNLFLGVQIQCAQCHVHPFVADWTQKDFWGLAAFFGKTTFEREAPAKGKPMGAATVKEVETKAPAAKPANAKGKSLVPVAKAIPPQFAQIAIPDPNDPAKKVGAARAKFFESDIPSLNRIPYRPTLAAWLTSPSNPYFSRAMVNRTWAHFMGRGFVNPLDDFQAKNQPSHPALLQQLANEFAQHGFDQKLMIRAICNSNAYQRTSRPVATNLDDDRLFSHMTLKVLPARDLLASLVVATSPVVKIGTNKPGKEVPLQQVRFFDTAEAEADPSEFTQGIPQLLRLMNSSLTNSSNEVVGRLLKSTGSNPDRMVEEIYLHALSRRPTPGESQRMRSFVTKQKDPAQGYAGVLWALLNSAEFTSNR